MRIKRITVVIAILSIALALTGYVNFHEHSILNALFDNIYRTEKNYTNSFFYQFMNNWGFDFVWAFTFNILLMALIDKKASCIIVLLLSVILEILQWLIPWFGTFDLLDIFSEFLGIVFSLLVLCLIERNNKNE